MKKKIAEQTNKVRIKFEKFSKIERRYLDQIFTKLNAIESSIIDHKDYWMGEWYSQNYDVYRELNGKESENYRYSFDQFKEHINQCLKTNTDDVLHKANQVLIEYLDFNEYLTTELSLLSEVEGFENEIKQFNKLIKFQWKPNPRTIVDHIRPKSGGFEFHQLGGVIGGEFNIPPHIQLAAQIASMIALQDTLKLYSKSVQKLLRLLEIKSELTTDTSLDAITKLNELCNRFHKTAVQLRNRYDNRATIIIKDEYDVQDVVHALLKQRFDDIRPEEYSPSYAGKNTRIDFLLKDDKILLEIKKTRENLRDNKIGSELILDIARYKNHPDCDTLYCFVYDPQSLISNPKGLENDLMQSSTEDFQVIVKITP